MRVTERLGPFPKCSYDKCVRASQSFKGSYCSSHYHRARRGQDMDAPFRTDTKPCAKEGCDRLASARGLCTKHYERQLLGIEIRDNWACSLGVCDRTVALRSGALLCSTHRTLATKYGLTEEGLITLWGDGSCQLCGSTRKPSIDHDHSCCPVGNGPKCGKCNRGILCHSCNLAAGYARDSPEILRSLADYIESYAILKQEAYAAMT